VFSTILPPKKFLNLKIEENEEEKIGIILLPKILESKNLK
jgi:hypothetical protein